MISSTLPLPQILAATFLLHWLSPVIPSLNAADASMFPPESRIGSGAAELQRLMVSPLDVGAVSNEGKYRMKSTSVVADPDLEAKAGMQALRFSGEAEIGGAKGDFAIADSPPGEMQELGVWVHLTPDSNVKNVGFQVIDEEGESLLALMDADWQGWKWVELNLTDDTFRQAYNQKDKNGEVDMPLKSVHIAWFTQSEGSTSLSVDALVGLSKIEAPSKAYRIESISPPWGEPGEVLEGQVVIHNFSDSALSFDIKASLQTNPAYRRPELPDPVHGSDHAQGQPSWLEMGGERVDDGSLTDGDAGNHLKPAMPKDGLKEIFHYVDLGESRTLTRIGWVAGDANWVNQLDVAASVDGESFTPIESLQNLELHKQWGEQYADVSDGAPARFLRLRYHNAGQDLLVHFRTLSALYAYDGVADETVAIPEVGKQISVETLKIEVPPRSFSVVPFEATPPLATDAYLLGMEAETGGLKEVAIADYFVMPAEPVELKPDSRFGINVSRIVNIELLKRIGFGWVRFENMKWRFYNPAPDDFRFDGTVQPWVVPHDEYYKAFRDAGMSILPYIFQTPDWASTAPEGTEKNIGGWPPEDNADYAKAIFQAVARYGTREVPEDQLLTSDKLSGLDLVNTYELWNEQNLNAEAWGFFVGSLEQYYPMFREAAEAAKAADPAALVTNGGWAGLSMEWIDTMRTYEYPDGKTPLDFTDVINVHFYVGKQDPEYATKDPNAVRDGSKPDDLQTLERDLVDLADWRDELKPDMPIWVTETGHDVGGPMGLTERHQAAKLTRGNMLAFANGVEKMFIYRESGSDPAQHAGAGLLRNDGSLRASFFSVANQIRQLDGAMDLRVPRLMTEDPDVWMYYWKRADGDVLTAWAPLENSTLGIDLGRCVVIGAFGGRTEMEVTKDFPLTMFPVYISKISNIAPIEGLQKAAADKEEARKRQMAFDAKADALLFDFGSTEFIGTKKLGRVRPFTPVLMEEIYDAEKGYGFESQPAGQDSLARWMRSPLEKDSADIRKPATFKVLANPGTYVFQFKGRAFKDGAELVIEGANEGVIILPLQPGKDGAVTKPQKLTTVAGQTLNILLPTGHTEWLTLIESNTGE